MNQILESQQTPLTGVYCEDFEENWPRYNGIALYFACIKINESIWTKRINKRTKPQ